MTVTVTYLVRPQEFLIKVNGLMPSTTHYFYFDSIKQSSSKMRPKNKNKGDSLNSDGNGYLEFTYFFDGDAPESNSTLENLLRSGALSIGLKSYTITNKDFGNDLPADYFDRSKSYATNVLEIAVDKELSNLI
jgi:hypothetical protein